MIRLFAVPAAIAAVPALAHPGHVAAEAGHNHYLAIAATVAATALVGIGIVRVLIRRRRRTAHG